MNAGENTSLEIRTYCRLIRVPVSGMNADYSTTVGAQSISCFFLKSMYFLVKISKATGMTESSGFFCLKDPSLKNY
jgi:hypothetical protein